MVAGAAGQEWTTKSLTQSHEDPNKRFLVAFAKAAKALVVVG